MRQSVPRHQQFLFKLVENKPRLHFDLLRQNDTTSNVVRLGAASDAWQFLDAESKTKAETHPNEDHFEQL